MIVRDACEEDLPAVAGMIDSFVQGHPAAARSRPLAHLRAAYLSDKRVAHLLVAVQRDQIVGMVQWSLFYDQFWSLFGVRGEWLFVQPAHRGRGVAAALIAKLCSDARRDGAEYLQAGSDADENTALYERFAIGHATRECHLSAEAFHSMADLADLPIRDIVRGLPHRDLNRVQRVR